MDELLSLELPENIYLPHTVNSGTKDDDKQLDDSQKVKDKFPVPDKSEVFKNQLQLLKQKSLFRKRKIKKQYKDDYQIISLSYPERMQSTKKNKKKYKILITYKDHTVKQAPVVRTKTVFFGTVGQNDYVDDLNNDKRLHRIKMMKNTSNPFSSNHFRLLLLNRCQNIRQSYHKYRKQCGLLS